MSYALNRPVDVTGDSEPLPDFQSIGGAQSTQYCLQNAVVEVTSPEGIVESGGERPKSSADAGTTYRGGMKCRWFIKPKLTAEAVQKNSQLQGLLATPTAIVLNIEYASLEASYESAILRARLPVVERFESSG